MDARLIGLEPSFQELINNLLQRALDLQPEVGVFCGLRTFGQQDVLYTLGRTVKNRDGYPAKPMGHIVTRARGGESWHNYGLAVDLVFRVNGKWSWDTALPWNKIGQLAEEQGLEWGGRWKFLDLPHIQRVAGLEISEAKDLYSRGGLPAVWEAVNSRLRGGLT